MGFDKLLNFLNYNLNSDITEDINIKSNIRKILVNHIMFDISFIIYQSLIELEEEINTIIKIILSLPFSIFNFELIEEDIFTIISKIYWKNNIGSIDNILNGNNENEIINNFLLYIKSNNILENIISDNIFYKIINFITDIHHVNNIVSINIIFDGIPSYSKILEQRRRRIKNYIESKVRKNKFDSYFKNIENSYYEHNNYKYNFYKWLKYRFSIDKSFGPFSKFTNLLEKKLHLKLLEFYSTIKININSSTNNGEADYKIFNEIYKNNYIGDIVIHTIDSDLIHQMIIQQNYFNIINKDINIAVIKYNSKNNIFVQYINGQLINNNLKEKYNFINSINKSSLNIIYDLALIFYFFGNDHLPTSLDLGPELNLDFYCKNHYTSLKTNYVINIDSNNKINFNINNFLLWLNELNKNNEINTTKIILNRYFKINYQLIMYLTDKLELNFNKIIELSKKILFDNGKENENNLDTDDLRYNLIKKYKNIEYPINISTVDINEFKLNMTRLLSILDISEKEENYCGLPQYNKNFYFIEDKFENIYINFNDNIVNELTKKYLHIYDNITLKNILFSKNLININQLNTEIYSYLKKIYHLVTTLFGNMSEYNSNNYTYYIGYEVPSLLSIINFIKNNKNIINNINNDILLDTTTNNKYLNSINHHLIITPYIKDILHKFQNTEIDYFIKNININSFWFDFNNDFKYKDFNLYNFIDIWKETLIKLSLNIKFNPIILIESEQYLINF